MLYDALLLLEQQLNAYFNDARQTDTSLLASPVWLESIAQCSEKDLKAGKNIFISLVQVAEPHTWLNQPAHSISGGAMTNQHLTTNLNLNILICVCMPQQYKLALKHLSHLVQFFKVQRVFRGTTNCSDSYTDETQKSFSIVVDLYEPSVEDAYYLWRTVGHRQYPYLFCKVRLQETAGSMEPNAEDAGIAASAS